DLLLIVRSHRRGRLLSHDRYDRRAVHASIVQAIQQVDGAGAGRSHAHAHLPRELGMCAGHESGHLLMSRLDKSDAILEAIQRAENAVNAVTGVTVNARDPPFVQPIDNEITYSLAHRFPPGPGRFLPLVPNRPEGNPPPSGR